MRFIKCHFAINLHLKYINEFHVLNLQATTLHLFELCQNIVLVLYDFKCLCAIVRIYRTVTSGGH